MRPGTLARRYARALFELATRQDALDAVGDALARTSDVLVVPEVMRVLTGPLARERKRALLEKIVAAASVPAVVRDFLQLLAERDRIKYAPAIAQAFDAMLDAKNGVTRARIESAAPLSAEALEEITRVFGVITGKRVLATVEVVPDLIAGVIVDVDGKVYDGSLETQLGKLHQQMATGS